jgi:hypothetical protein
VKHAVTLVKDLDEVLRYLRERIKNPATLFSKDKSEKLDLLSREMLINWIFCSIWNHFHSDNPLTFSNDPSGSDGVLVYKNTLEGEVTEHVMAYEYKKTDVDAEDIVTNAILAKQKKGGKPYADGKHLMVFCEGIGKWFPNKVVRKIVGSHNFKSVWAIGLEEVTESNEYVYWVTNLDEEDHPTYVIKINFDDISWEVQ